MCGVKHGDWVSASSINEPRTNAETKRGLWKTFSLGGREKGKYVTIQINCSSLSEIIFVNSFIFIWIRTTVS